MNRQRFVARRKGQVVEPVAFSQNDITIKKSTAKKKSSQHRQRLLNANRLALILDLDKTLLHATVDVRASAIEGNIVIDYEAVKQLDIDRETLPSIDTVNVVWRFLLKDIEHFVKFRPGLIEFLHEFQKYFELSIFTAGSKCYAQKIVEILDPTKQFFGSRVVSRDDISSIWKRDNQVFKSLERIFPFDDSFAVILDDSPGVWTGNLDNLLQVAPYTYFKGMKDVNVFDNTSESTNPELDQAEEHERGKASSSSNPVINALVPIDSLVNPAILLPPIKEVTPCLPPSTRRIRCHYIEIQSLSSVLKEAHRKFFKKKATSIKPILVHLKKLVFKNVCICFSDLFLPEHADNHPCVNLAERFGATVSLTVDDSVTHVVARDPNSAMVRRALAKPGVYIVSVEWLRVSIGNYYRQKEKRFAFTGLPYRVTTENAQPLEESLQEARQDPCDNPLKRNLQTSDMLEDLQVKKSKTLGSLSPDDFLEDFY